MTTKTQLPMCLEWVPNSLSRCKCFVSASSTNPLVHQIFIDHHGWQLYLLFLITSSREAKLVRKSLTLNPTLGIQVCNCVRFHEKPVNREGKMDKGEVELLSILYWVFLAFVKKVLYFVKMWWSETPDYRILWSIIEFSSILTSKNHCLGTLGNEKINH